MGSEVIVASTTDTQAEVNLAAGGVPQEKSEPELKPPPTGDEQVESEPVEAEPEPAAEPEKAEKPVPRNVDKRIDKLVKQNKELEAKVLALSQTKPAPAIEERPAPEPTVEKFPTFDSWTDKRTESGKTASIDEFLEERDTWKEQRRAQDEEKKAVQEAQTAIAESYNEKVEEFKASHEDWDEVVGQPIDLPAGVGPAILELDNGPDVAYYLGKNLAVAKKLNTMSPFLAVAEVGRIAARLEKSQEAPETQTNNVTTRSPDKAPIVSKAPQPIKPLTGHAVRATRDLSDPNLSFEEYRKIRDEQAKARFRR